MALKKTDREDQLITRILSVQTIGRLQHLLLCSQPICDGLLRPTSFSSLHQVAAQQQQQPPASPTAARLAQAASPLEQASLWGGHAKEAFTRNASRCLLGSGACFRCLGGCKSRASPAPPSRPCPRWESEACAGPSRERAPVPSSPPASHVPCTPIPPQSNYTYYSVQAGRAAAVPAAAGSGAGGQRAGDAKNRVVGAQQAPKHGGRQVHAAAGGPAGAERRPACGTRLLCAVRPSVSSSVGNFCEWRCWCVLDSYVHLIRGVNEGRLGSWGPVVFDFHAR